MFAQATAEETGTPGVGATFVSSDGKFLFTVTKTSPQEVSIAKTNSATLTGALDIPATVTCTWNPLQNEPTKQVIEYSVTSIGEKAFYNCSGITGSITIPSTITKIGNNAFQGCSGLTELNYNAIDIQTATSWFASCPNIATINIGNGVKTIPSWFMYQKTKVTTLTIPNTVTKIGDGAFREFTNLTSLIIEANSQLKTIRYEAFSKCSKLEEITIPSSVTTIDRNAFEYCTSLKTINYNAKKATVSSSGVNWLYGTFQITTVNIGNGVEKIPDYFMNGQKNITTITVPNTVQTIGSSAFSGCTGITSLTIDGNSQLTTIGSSAFSGCSGLTSVSIPNTVETIESYAFNGCSSLDRIEFADGNNNITLGASSLSGISSTAKIYNYNLVPPKVTFSSNPFGTSSTTDMRLYVSCISVPKYKQSDWKGMFANEDQIISMGNEATVSIVNDHLVIPVDQTDCKTKLKEEVTILPNASLSFDALTEDYNPTSDQYKSVADQLKTTDFIIQKQLELNKWNLVANNFNGATYDIFNTNYGNNSKKIHDIAALPFDYSKNDWYNGWKTYDESLPSQEEYTSMFVWPFADWIVETNADGTLKEVEKDGKTEHVTTNTNPNDDYVILPMKITKNTSWEMTETTTTKAMTPNNTSNATGKVFALYNPFVGQLEVKKFLEDNGSDGSNNTKIQGGIIYAYNSVTNNWYELTTSNNGSILPGSGFMIISTNNESNPTLDFRVQQIHRNETQINIYSKSTQKEMLFTSKANETQRQAKAIMNPNSENGFDNNDGYLMISTNNTELVEPYFIVENQNLIQNSFKSLPYETPIGFHASKYSRVEFGVENVPEDIEVSLIDKKAANKETIISDGTTYSFNVKAGENTDRFTIKFNKKNIDINETNTQNNDITINTTNNEIFINGTNLKTLQIINTLGQIIQEQNLNGNTYQTTLDLPSGAYIIKVTTKNNTKTEKIVIK